MSYTKFNDDVFIVDCWTDTVEKENTLIELLNRLKVFNVQLYCVDITQLNLKSKS